MMSLRSRTRTGARRCGRRASVAAVTGASMLVLASSASGTTSTVYHWDLYEYVTNYGTYSASGNFRINHGWTVDMAHTSVVSANYASNLGLIGKNEFPAHSTRRRFIDQTTELLRGTRWILRGRSAYSTQYNRNGEVQY